MIKKAGCILINIVNKEIALVCRNGEYSFPKGHLEINETIRECAIRETIEETGHSCHLVNNKEISINHYKDSKGNAIENYFYLAIVLPVLLFICAAASSRVFCISALLFKIAS